MIVYTTKPMIATAIHWSSVTTGTDKIRPNMTFETLVEDDESNVDLSKLFIVLNLTLINKVKKTGDTVGKAFRLTLSSARRHFQQ